MLHLPATAQLNAFEPEDRARQLAAELQCMFPAKPLSPEREALTAAASPCAPSTPSSTYPALSPYTACDTGARARESTVADGEDASASLAASSGPEAAELATRQRGRWRGAYHAHV